MSWIVPRNALIMAVRIAGGRARRCGGFPRNADISWDAEPLRHPAGCWLQRRNWETGSRVTSRTASCPRGFLRRGSVLFHRVRRFTSLISATWALSAPAIFVAPVAAPHQTRSTDRSGENAGRSARHQRITPGGRKARSRVRRGRHWHKGWQSTGGRSTSC